MTTSVQTNTIYTSVYCCLVTFELPPFTTLTYLIVHVTELLRYLLTALITMSRTIKYLQVSIFCICQRIKNLGQSPRAKIRSKESLRSPCCLVAAGGVLTYAKLGSIYSFSINL